LSRNDRESVAHRCPRQFHNHRMPAKETLKNREDIDDVGKDKEEASSVEVSSVAFEQVGSGVLSLIQRQRVAL